MLNLTSCRGHGAFPTIYATATAGGGIVTIGDSVSRCSFSGTSGACYFTSPFTTGIANNATSSIAFTNVATSHVAGTSDDLGSICNDNGSFSVTLTHGVNQSNQTLTITTV